MRADNRRAYDSIADEWFAARQALGARESTVLDAVVARLAPSARILDLGCGTGRPIAERMVARGFTVTGVDQSAAMLAHARRLLPASEWIESPIETFTTAGRFDAVIAWDSLFHIPREAMPGIFANVATILEPGGVFACTLGGSAQPAFEDEMFGERFFYDAPPPERVEGLLTAAGLRLVESQVLNHPDGGRDKGRNAYIAMR